MIERNLYFKAKLEYEIDSADLMTAIKNGDNVIIIDARSKEAYSKEHIIGSINIPHREMNSLSTKDLDRDALIVTYCDGIGCNASTKGAYKMSELDFNVKELIGGIDWWKRDGYKTDGISSCEINANSEADTQCGCL
jgi:rhodanese-related sulfurtransferase